MAKIVVKFARDEFSTFGKYWGIFLFLFFIFWLLFRDNGDAGYLDMDGKKIARLKYKKKKHPLEISIPAGEHIITYRKKSKLSMGLNKAIANAGNDGSFMGSLGNSLNSVATKGDTTSYRIRFNDGDKLVIRVEGGINKAHSILDDECVFKEV